LSRGPAAQTPLAHSLESSPAFAFFSIIAASPLDASAAAFASICAVAAMGRQATLVSE